jgi:phosphoribosylanthranilate isomerase
MKFCGITRLEDAVAAADCGAAAIGFVFAPASPRAITPDAARAISRHLPPFLQRVGVFVDRPAAEVRGVAEHVGLDVVQLHGRETVADAAAAWPRVLKALPRDADPMTEAEAWPDDVTLLVDAATGDAPGGTGQVADWPAAAALARRRRIVLAGGLTADNVAGAAHRQRARHDGGGSSGQRDLLRGGHAHLAAGWQACVILSRRRRCRGTRSRTRGRTDDRGASVAADDLSQDGTRDRPSDDLLLVGATVGTRAAFHVRHDGDGGRHADGLVVDHDGAYTQRDLRRLRAIAGGDGRDFQHHARTRGQVRTVLPGHGMIERGDDLVARQVGRADL